eukprot:5273111-Prymnesium_polylepis.1
MATRAALVGAVGAAAVAAAAAVYRRRSLAEAERVLAFWFDGDPDELYATRWFVAAGSAAQAALDEEVRQKFGALLD